ncbi:MAG TPA: baseplate J/gp47 family protein [Acidimicrobiia bacterium]|jgi:uncharacterized phage protein gp47/JayE
MSYAAEPYAVFVDDLVSNLTGGVTRIRFRFVEEEQPFQLSEPEVIRTDSVRVHGIVDGAFHRFSPETDYALADDGTVVWREDPATPGVAAATATWPDSGSDFWVSYDPTPGHGVPPVLTDRNPGSITRTLAESFAIEFAVIAHQLDAVYKAAHLETAKGKDLDHLVALLGVTRRGQTHARGEVTFRRSTPAPADVTVPAGTLVSTAEPPLVTVETTEAVTLRRATLSAAAPVRARAEGAAGVAPAQSLRVIHRPILGVEEATNPAAMSFGGGAESDVELRARAERALASGGRATVEAIRSALASLEGIREQDVLVSEDHLAFPGVVKVKVAAELTQEVAHAASLLLEETRPAGIRVVHNLPAPTVPVPAVGGETGGGGDGPAPGGPVVDDLWFPIRMAVTVTPSSSELTETQRQRLGVDLDTAVRGLIEAIGISEPVIYNRIVAGIMAVEGVYDTVVDVGPGSEESTLGRTNLAAPAGTRPRLDAGALTVTLRGALVALDITAQVELFDLAATEDPASVLAVIADDVAARLTAELQVAPDVVTPEVLLGKLPDTADYSVEALSYKAELLEEGLRVQRTNVTIDLAADQQPWVRSVSAVQEGILT